MCRVVLVCRSVSFLVRMGCFVLVKFSLVYRLYRFISFRFIYLLFYFISFFRWRGSLAEFMVKVDRVGNLREVLGLPAESSESTSASDGNAGLVSEVR